MSVYFFITPYKPSEWQEARSDLRIDPVEYGEAMRERWPDVQFYTAPPSPDYVLNWMLKEGDDHLTGSLRIDQQVVAFDPAPKSVFVAFILWHRAFVPSEYQLFLSDSSSEDVLELGPGITEQDVLNFTGQVC
jgi:hypothetical protein